MPEGNYQLNIHLHCRQCGYDLHGLDTTGSCPECNEPIAESIDAAADPPDRLRLPVRIRVYPRKSTVFGFVHFLISCYIFFGLSLGVGLLAETI